MPKKHRETASSQEIKKIKKQAQEYLDGWKRARADFENYKKNEAKRTEEALLFIKADFIAKLLPILDSFDQAVKTVPQKEKNSDWVKGILKIRQQMLDLLKEEKVEEIKAQGEEFNPLYHEAIGEAVVKDKAKKDKVIQVLQKGYKIKEQVIRPARVYVGK